MKPWLSQSIRRYIRAHLSFLIAFQTVCVMQYLLETVATSMVFSQFVDNPTFSSTAIRQSVLLFVAKFVLSTLKSWLELKLFPGMFSWFRNDLFREYLHIQNVHFDDRSVSADIRDLNEAIQLIQPVWFWVMTELIPAMTMMLFLVVYFLVKHPVVGAIQLAAASVNLYLIRGCLSTLFETYPERYAAYGKVLSDLEEKAQNVMNVILCNQIDQSVRDHADKEDEWLPLYTEECREIQRLVRYVTWSINVSTALSLFWMYRNTRTAEFVQAFLFFSFYTQTSDRVLDYIPEMMRLYSRMIMISNALHDKVFSHDSSDADALVHPDATIQYGDVELRDVCFSYFQDDQNPILSHLTWSIPAGRRVALRAPSGSGKSTLMKLLLKLYQPNAGEIRMDGIPLSHIDRTHLRESIHYVNQRTVLFHDTVMNNVLFGSPSFVEESDVEELVDRYHLQPILGDLHRMVDYGGVNLSLGMQKVIFLLRGVLHARRPQTKLLVLDEPLSSLDPYTRQSVVKMLREACRACTLIVITHDEVGDLVEETVELSALQR